jgi:hypothetical protein
MIKIPGRRANESQSSRLFLRQTQRVGFSRAPRIWRASAALVDMINLGLRDHMAICGGEACLCCQSQAEGSDLVCLICTMKQACLFSACACPPGIRLPPVSGSHRSLGQYIAQAGRESIPRGHGRSENRETAPDSYCRQPKVRALSAGASRGVLTIEGPKKIG